MITVILPLATMIFYVAFILQVFSSISASFSGVPPTFDSALILSAVPRMLAGVISFAVFSLVSFLVGMYYLSKYYNTPKIFNNVLKAFLIDIATIAAVLIAIFAAGVIMLNSSIISPDFQTFSFDAIWNFLIVVLLIVLAAYAISIYCALLYKRSFDLLADKSGISDFRTAGLLYLIGIIVPIGLIVWIAWIFAALSYYKLKPTLSSQETPLPSQNSPTTKYCSHCGAENLVDAKYCSACGCQIL